MKMNPSRKWKNDLKENEKMILKKWENDPKENEKMFLKKMRKWS